MTLGYACERVRISGYCDNCHMIHFVMAVVGSPEAQTRNPRHPWS
jgi:hypothetical protein